MSQEVEGIDFFTSDLIKRTRARKKRLEKELEQQPVSAAEPATEIVFDENLGQVIRKPVVSASGYIVAAASPAKSIVEIRSPTKSVLSDNRAQDQESPPIPFIDKSSAESLPSPSVKEMLKTESSAEDLPRYKVEIPSRFSPVKKRPSRTFSPVAFPSQASAPKLVAAAKKTSFTPATSAAAGKATSPPNTLMPGAKPILEKFKVMQAEVSSERQAADGSAKPADEVPVTSIRGRIQKLEHIFSQQRAEAPPSPAPETLSLKHKKVLFEKKIREEAAQKIAGLKRNEYLAQKRGRSESKLPVGSEGIVAKMQQKILAAQAADSVEEADRTGVTDTLSQEMRAAPDANEKIENTAANCVEKKSNDFYEMNNEESALAAFFDIEKMESGPAEVEMELDQQDQYFSKPCTASSSGDADSMSMCTQSSQSDREFDSLPSSPAKSSTSSGKMYPDLPDEQEDDTFPSSPKKIRFRDEVTAEPVAAAAPPPPASNVSTPLRTLSMYRMEQKQRQNDTPQMVPKVVAGKGKPNRPSCDLQDEERKANLRRRIHLLKTVDVPRYEALANQSNQALKACLSGDFRDTASHADAERHVLVSNLKRVTALNEIHTLNAQINSPMQRENVGGHLTVQRLDVPIMRDNILAHKRGLNSKSQCESHYYFCVATCGPVVHSTECLSFSDSFSTGFLSFNLHSGFVLPDLRNNFQLRVDIYEVTLIRSTKKESSRTIRLTPRKHSHPVAAADESQGPLAQLKGSVIVNVKNMKKKEFDFQNFRFESTLQGSIRISLTVAPDYKNDYCNFLNFYDEKVDIGTWKRRWCHLSGPAIKFWRLPEDEEAGKKPLGEIDLRHCINPAIAPAPFDVCPRKESFVLVFAGTATDKTRLRVNWLVNKNYRDVIERSLVAADVLEERDEWISVLSDVLDGMRLWDEEALIPCSPTEMESYMNV